MEIKTIHLSNSGLEKSGEKTVKELIRGLGSSKEIRDPSG